MGKPCYFRTSLARFSAQRTFWRARQNVSSLSKAIIDLFAARWTQTRFLPRPTSVQGSAMWDPGVPDPGFCENESRIPIPDFKNQSLSQIFKTKPNPRFSKSIPNPTSRKSRETQSNLGNPGKKQKSPGSQIPYYIRIISNKNDSDSEIKSPDSGNKSQMPSFENGSQIPDFENGSQIPDFENESHIPVPIPGMSVIPGIRGLIADPCFSPTRIFGWNLESGRCASGRKCARNPASTGRKTQSRA